LKIFKAEEFTWDVPIADETVMEELPDIPYMSENFCFSGHDSENRVGYLLHIGRWIKDPEILREMLILWLPNGDILWAQSFGRGDCTRGPAAACVRVICEEPGKKIRIRYAGPMQHVPLEQVANPAPNPLTLDKVEVDLMFEGSSPMWYYPQVEGAMWSKWHTEQLGKARGQIKHGEKVHAFNGVAYRDHSRGPRHLKDFRGHSWIQGQFPGGDAFAVYQMWQMIDGKEVQVLSEAKLFRDGAVIPAQVISAPRLTSAAEIIGDYEMVLDAGSGRIVIEGKPRALAFFSYGSLMSHFLPSMPVGVTDYFMTTVEQPSVFRCDGKAGTGHTERSFYRGDTEKVFDPACLRDAYRQA